MFSNYKCLKILFALLLIIKSSKALEDDVLDVIHIAEEVAKFVAHTWHVLEEYNNLVDSPELELPYIREKYKKLFDSIKVINEKIDETAEKNSENVAAALDSVRNAVIENTEITLQMSQINDIQDNIQSMYKEMLENQKYENTLEKNTIIKFAEWVVSPNSYAAQQLLERLHLILFGNPQGRGFNNRPKNMFDDLLNIYEYAHNVASAVESVSEYMATNIPLMTKMNEISDTINRISTRFEQMKKYEAHQDKLEATTLITFAEWSVSPNPYSIHHLMDRLQLTLLGPVEKENQTTNMLSMLAQNYENFMNQQENVNEINERAILDIADTVQRNDKTFSMSRIFENIELIMVKQALYYRAAMTSTDQICTTQQSPQQFVYSLYADIALTELKGYTMMEFSWMMLRIYGKGNFTQEAELMRLDYEKRTERTLKLLKEVMRRADRIVWRCDPMKYVKGKTFDEVTRLLQGYIENEVDLNNDETCRETCDYYQSTRSEGCFKSKFCAQQPRCSGKIYHCTFVDSDMWVCPASSNSTRRYEYIEYENGRTLGQRGYCARGTTKVDSWWRYLFWHCSYCFCLCDEQGWKSDRYFNLRETLADVKNNNVITGLRFVKHNRVFHIQIQEGQLLPRGAVNASTLKWKPVEEYNIYDRDVRNGRDYHTLSYESRSVDLDDIHTDDQTYVVTGVRFRVVGRHLNLEAHLSEFDFEDGSLINPEENSFWKSNDNTDVSGERRQKITLSSPDMSSRSIVKSTPDSRHNQYIEFVNTDMNKDAAQSTVPFIDIQDVVSNPPVPLSGIGIYHKGQPNFGGFLAPKIMTYDFTPHVKLPSKTTINDNNNYNNNNNENNKNYYAVVN